MLIPSNLFFCRQYQYQLSVVYRCIARDKAQIYRLFSYDSHTLLLQQGVTPCCDNTCCHHFEEGEEKTLSNSSLTELPTLTEESWGSTYSPQIWTGSVVLLLALFLLVQNFYILGKKRWKKNKILPILQQESAGPFATTAMGPGGFVIPKVVYHPTPPPNPPGNLRRFAAARQSHEILGVMESIEETDSDVKIIGLIEPQSVSNSAPKDKDRGKDKKKVPDSKTTLWTDRLEQGRVREAPLTIVLPDALLPPYHHHRKVDKVWEDDHEVQALYRYTSLDRLVYPPGTVDDGRASGNLYRLA